MRLVRAAFVLASALGAISIGIACTSFSEEPGGQEDGGSESGTDAGAADAAPPRSCADILKRDPATAKRDGVYQLPSDGGPTPVYCDMTIEGGGWTLVGRSAPGTSDKFADFGWNKKTGDLADLAFPYSVDAIGLGLVFDQVLVADRSPSGGAGDIAFRFRVSADFVNRRNAPVLVGPAAYVRGPCNPPGGPSMLKYAGATGNNNNFLLRDIESNDTRNGLDPGGFDLVYPECARSGLLDGRQGVMFVR